MKARQERAGRAGVGRVSERAGKQRAERRDLTAQAEDAAARADRCEDDAAAAAGEIALDEQLQLVRRDVAPAAFDVVEQLKEDIVVGEELLALLFEHLVVLLPAQD